MLTCLSDQSLAVASGCEYTIPDYSGLYGVYDNCTDSASIVYTQLPLAGSVLPADGTTTTITLTATDSSGNVSSCSFQLTLSCDVGITVYKGFSPDGDGNNDLFVIDGIDNYPEASVTIFNRWGNTVYKSEGGYNNDWDGTSTEGVRFGDNNNLPVGTYFYIIDLGEATPKEDRIFKGYIYIQR